VALLEKYFGRPFPFPKLDQIGSPVMPGAMENAGADTYGDNILLLEKGASTGQKQAFGMVVAHELSHQWFGDLVTPAWWDDIWLNESFANWMGYRIGNEWRPDLKISANAIDEAFTAMNTDALKAGRPIHQHIATNGEIDSAFDSVTYGKGGQVVAMIAAYLGDEKFRDGVRLHLNRHAYGNATSEDFFAALAEAAHDPRVVTAMKSFVDQQGVPVVRVERSANGLTLSQKRYVQLGTTVAPQSWTIPMCLRIGQTKQCSLLDKTSMTVPVKASGAILPNVDGAGYYRFSLPEAEWHALIAQSASLPAGEALALTDSLWAGFRAGEVRPALLVEAARAMAANPNSIAAVDGGTRLSGLRVRGMIPAAALPAYRKLIDGMYRPTLDRLGLDPKAGAYAAEDPDRQHLRSQIVGLLSSEAQDSEVDVKLAAAAKLWLGGDKAALDPALFSTGLNALVATGGEAAATSLFDTALNSADTRLRASALAAIGGSGDAKIGQWLIAHLGDKRLRVSDRTDLLSYMMHEPETRDVAWAWFAPHFDAILKEGGIFSINGLLSMPSRFCSAAKADEIEATLRPKVNAGQRGGLPLDRTVELIHDCGVLEQQRGGEIAAAMGS
jgi:aminopeptidase N